MPTSIPASSPIRVLVIDDHRSVLWGLGKLIESARPRMQLADTATCRREAMAAMAQHHPDVVLLDLDLGDEEGLELLPALRDDAAVVILTGSRDALTRERAVMQGARGVIHKAEPAEVILKAIVRVHAGETWVDRGTMGRLLNTLATQRRAAPPARVGYDTLSPAERKVLGAVLRKKGAPNKVIAASLNLSEHTLRNHLSAVYDKLGIHRRVELVLYAIEHKLDRLPA